MKGIISLSPKTEWGIKKCLRYWDIILKFVNLNLCPSIKSYLSKSLFNALFQKILQLVTIFNSWPTSTSEQLTNIYSRHHNPLIWKGLLTWSLFISVSAGARNHTCIHTTISANHGVTWKGHYISSHAELTTASLKGCLSGWFTSLFLFFNY